MRPITIPVKEGAQASQLKVFTIVAVTMGICALPFASKDFRANEQKMAMLRDGTSAFSSPYESGMDSYPLLFFISFSSSHMTLPLFPIAAKYDTSNLLRESVRSAEAEGDAKGPPERNTDGNKLQAKDAARQQRLQGPDPFKKIRQVRDAAAGRTSTQGESWLTWMTKKMWGPPPEAA